MKPFVTKFMLAILVMAMFLCTFVGCNDSGPSQVAGGSSDSDKVKPDALVIASGSSAGTYYFIATGQAKILSEKIPGLTVSNEATNGTVNYDLAAQDPDTIGMGGLEQLVSAIEGKEDRGYPVALENLRCIQAGHKFIMYCVVAENSDIKTFADLNGKKIGRPALTGSSTPMIDMLYEAYGVDPGTLKETPASHAENIDALKDGTVDAIFVAGGVPMAGLTDLVTAKDIRFLDIDAALLEPYMSKANYFELLTIPANTYSKQTQPVNLLTVDVVLAVNERLDDDLVYEITKALNESVDELEMIHVDGAEWNLENSLALYNKNVVPFHPGAARYYEENK